ncbi:MAG TPA: cytochrome d ubiquinol oxidase subunit II [Polyangiaceae bacterium]
MPELWFSFVVLALAAYAVLDGFDLGAGTLHLTVAKTEEERGRVLSSIGPYWDGNEVWLIAAGGTLLLAFPHALAVAFSGFYLALFLVLWALMLRGMSIELRSHLPSPLWRSFWDAVFFVSSSALALLFGVALGNVLRGVPLGEDDYFTLPLFASGGAAVGLLDAYTVLVGATAVVVLAAHGALFLVWKNDGPVRDRARRLALPLQLGTILLTLASLVATAKVARLTPRGGALVVFAIAASALVASIVASRRGRERAAFLASCAFIAASLVGVGVARFPVLVPSMDGHRALDAYGAASSTVAMGHAVPWYVVALVLIFFYFANLFRVHRGKVGAPPPPAEEPHGEEGSEAAGPR